MHAWRIAARNTHLYPGARMQGLDPALRRALRAGDTVTIEFSDQGIVQGEVLACSDRGWHLQAGPHATMAGTAIAAKRWLIEWVGADVDAAADMRVKAHLT
ncbi:hypothetical protein J2W24_006594 [Variovorax boronicumulans]|uniref:hypothetical protein n=1 Tax=Variovorax boronicumulans TaxID=436515 RepID=UPI002780734D|nr:hypothetical protein [Variovorax boronicumulans]MDP9920912.1 hypothetical protein [Variovorax boronicumulans]